MSEIEGVKTGWEPAFVWDVDTGYEVRVNVRPCDDTCQCGNQDKGFPRHIFEFRPRVVEPAR